MIQTSIYVWLKLCLPCRRLRAPRRGAPLRGRRPLASRATRGCADCAAAERERCGAETPARRNKGERQLAAFGWHSLGAF
eukprot:2916323-Heterocapsa_arctica.AAC.1